MSTIAFDGKTIAFDTQSGNNNRVDLEAKPKVIEIEGSVDRVYHYAGGCGELGLLFLFMRWIKDGGEFPKLCSDYANDRSCSFFAITYDGVLHEFERSEIPINETRKPDAYGSGAQFAMGAMMHGATAEEAVAISCKLDVYTGGEVRSFEVGVGSVVPLPNSLRQE